MRQAVAEYRDQQDILHDFLVERCVFERNATIATKDFWNDYKKWCAETDIYQLKQRDFYNRIRERGVMDDRGTGNKPIFRGVRLIKEGEIVTRVTNVTEFHQSFLHEAIIVKTLVKNGNKGNSSNYENSTAAELPDCPACGENEWVCLPNGDYQCGNCLGVTPLDKII